MIEYIGTGTIATWFGVERVTVNQWHKRYPDFPEPDAMTDGKPGWLPQREGAIREWEANRPGQGAGGGRPTKTEGAGVYEAKDPRTQETYKFRKLSALARRLGGDGFQVVHSPAFNPPTRKIEVLRRNRYERNAHDIVAVLIVPSEAVTEEP